MANAVDSIVRFDDEIVKGIEQTRLRAEEAAAEVMNGLAQHVIESGGYCDDKTFATVFFGGIDPTMNWGDRFTNEGLAALQIPEEFKQAQRLGRTVAYSCFEPFVAKDSGSDSKDDIGIVMPGTEEYDGMGIGYKISQPEVWHTDARKFIGQIVFKGYSRVRTYRPYDEHELFSVKRHEMGLATTCSVDDRLEFGVAAVREHVLSPLEYLRDSASSKLTEYIDNLRTAAKQHVES